MFGFGACGSKHPGAHGGFGPPWAAKGQECGGPAAILRELNLTEEQLEKAAELKLEGLAACAQFKLAIGKSVKQIADQLTQEKIDRAKIKELAQQIKEQKSQMGEAMVERVITFAEALTPEQRKKVKATAIRCFLGLANLPEV